MDEWAQRHGRDACSKRKDGWLDETEQASRCTTTRTRTQTHTSRASVRLRVSVRVGVTHPLTRDTLSHVRMPVARQRGIMLTV